MCSFDVLKYVPLAVRKLSFFHETLLPLDLYVQNLRGKYMSLEWMEIRRERSMVKEGSVNWGLS